MPLQSDVETMRPEDFEMPDNAVVFILDGNVSMAYIGAPAVEARMQAESIYRMLTETNGDPKKMGRVVTRGVACMDMSLH